MLNKSFNIRETQRLVCPALWLCRPFQWRVMYNILLRYDTMYVLSCLIMIVLSKTLPNWLDFFLTSTTKRHLSREIDIYSTLSRISVFCHSIGARKVRLKATLINKHTKNWNCAKCEISYVPENFHLFMNKIFRKKREK